MNELLEQKERKIEELKEENREQALIIKALKYDRHTLLNGIEYCWESLLSFEVDEAEQEHYNRTLEELSNLLSI